MQKSKMFRDMICKGYLLRTVQEDQAGYYAKILRFALKMSSALKGKQSRKAVDNIVAVLLHMHGPKMFSYLFQMCQCFSLKEMYQSLKD